MLARKVLLVDDSKSARFVLGKLLQRHDLEVEMVDSAEAALEFLESEQPDAIFMDHMMPGMDGLAATSAIKNNPATAHIPVVMCTSSDGEDYQQQAQSHGALGTLMKPPASGRLKEILEAVNDAIGVGQSTQQEPLVGEQQNNIPAAGAGDLQQAIADSMRSFEQRFDDRLAAQGRAWDETLESRLAARDQVDSAARLKEFVETRMSQQQVELSLQLSELEKQISAKLAASGFESEVRDIAREAAAEAAENIAKAAAREVAAVCASEAVAPVLEQRLNAFASEWVSADEAFTREDAEQFVRSELDRQNGVHTRQMAELEQHWSELIQPTVAEVAEEAGRSAAKETASSIARELAYDAAGEAIAPILDDKLREITESWSAQQAQAARQSRQYAVVAALAGIVSAAAMVFFFAG